MYFVRHFAQQDEAVLRGHIAEYPLASLVVDGGQGPVADSVPFDFDPSLAPRGRLIGHVARANPLWQRFESGPALAIFSGPAAYVSPDWSLTFSQDPEWSQACAARVGRRAKPWPN